MDSASTAADESFQGDLFEEEDEHGDVSPSRRGSADVDDTASTEHLISMLVYVVQPHVKVPRLMCCACH